MGCASGGIHSRRECGGSGGCDAAPPSSFMVAGYCRLLEPAVAAHGGAGPGTLVFLLLRDLGDESLGGEEQGGDGSRVLQRGPKHLGGVDDARLHEVMVGVAQGVEA